jgi:hypothetical protein
MTELDKWTEEQAKLSQETAATCANKKAHFWCGTCGIVLEPGHELAQLRADLARVTAERDYWQAAHKTDAGDLTRIIAERDEARAIANGHAEHCPGCDGDHL